MSCCRSDLDCVIFGGPNCEVRTVILQVVDHGFSLAVTFLLPSLCVCCSDQCVLDLFRLVLLRLSCRPTISLPALELRWRCHCGHICPVAAVRALAAHQTSGVPLRFNFNCCSRCHTRKTVSQATSACLLPALTIASPFWLCASVFPLSLLTFFFLLLPACRCFCPFVVLLLFHASCHADRPRESRAATVAHDDFTKQTPSSHKHESYPSGPPVGFFFHLFPSASAVIMLCTIASFPSGVSVAPDFESCEQEPCRFCNPRPDGVHRLELISPFYSS